MGNSATTTKVTLKVGPAGDSGKGPIRSRYDAYALDREPYLNRARFNSKYTIPYIMPESRDSKNQVYYKKYSSIGAECVNHLSSKMAMMMLPTNETFFRYKLDEMAIKAIESEEEKALIDIELSSAERAIHDEVEKAGARDSSFEVMKHTQVAGNVIQYMPDDDTISLYHLDSFVVQRDPSDNVLEMITVESTSIHALPEHIKEAILEETPVEDGEANPMFNVEDQNVDIYTQILRDGNQWIISQEIEGLDVPVEGGNTYPLDECPWQHLRGIKVSGESYGRSYVEEYIDDIKSHDKLCKAIMNAAAIASKIIFIRRTTSTIKKKDLVKAESGDIIDGEPDDVKALQLEKHADLSIAAEQLNKIEKRLSKAFLLYSAVQRDAERVTAYELQRGMQELESAMGGSFTTNRIDYQVPLVKRMEARLKKRKEFPELPPDFVSPQITTGIEALGRGNDLNKIRAFVEMIKEIYGPDQVEKFLHSTEVINRLAAALSIDPNGLIKTIDEILKETQQNHTRAKDLATAGPLINQDTQLQTAAMGGDPQSEMPAG